MIARTIRALGWSGSRTKPIAHSAPAEVPANVGMIALRTIQTPTDLSDAMDACIRAYAENLDSPDLDTYMGVMEALDTIKRRVLKTLLTPEGDN
jgi:hypothetical protein